MNILYYSPGNTIGGAELSLLDILKEASKHGHNAYVALPPPKRDDLTYMEMLKQYCKAIFIVQPMRWNIPRKQKWYLRITNYLFNCYLSGWHIVPVFKLLRIIRKHNIDIIHTNTIMSIEPAFAAKLKCIPHIWHIREGIG
ncbi:MAG: glycosyltransferase, partial [Bacteroidetes bacterium]|nr:glycosyltransferase [Bacteroidota bacterium]